jgi:pSer/pThr/pTyr-binding forkhead associated (FHA) protein
MIVCPNCNHPNPDGAIQCEACYTPLPATTTCPNCGATVQADASFCGQCGYHLRAGKAAVAATVAPDIPPVEVQPLVTPEPLVQPQPLSLGKTAGHTTPDSSPLPPTAVAVPPESNPPHSTEETNLSPPPITQPVTEQKKTAAPPSQDVPAARTQLQQVTARLIHVQTNREVELPQNLSVIHIGKPNDRIPPDIDVSGFPNSEIVSRVHCDIRVESDAYYIEDVGSSNGTYINNLPLLPGNRHRLRPGDRISLGKGDLVTFLFQLS